MRHWPYHLRLNEKIVAKRKVLHLLLQMTFYREPLILKWGVNRGAGTGEMQLRRCRVFEGIDPGMPADDRLDGKEECKLQS